MMSVRYLNAIGPGWCKLIGAILSVPSALLFFVSFIAFVTLEVFCYTFNFLWGVECIVV